MVYVNADDLLDDITLPGAEGTVDLSYGGGGECENKLTGITKGSESVTLEYDGPIVTSQTLSGVLDATLEVGYLNTTQNHDFLPDSFTYAGVTEDLTYDEDTLLTGSGAFGIARDADTGLPGSIYDGTVELVPGFNEWAEMDALDYQIQSVSKASWGLTFDPYSAEITAKTETVAGTTTAYGYDYSDLGQLEEVTKNSTIVEEYLYDANGNREYQKVNGIERWLSYDAEDRLEGIFSDEPKTVQVADYDFDVDGFLTTKTEGNDFTTYDYSSLGELLSVTLPDSTEIEYLHDVLGRRVAKKVDGDITEKYLWAGMNQGLLAVYDGADNLVLRFEYAGGRLPMAMTYDSDTYYLAYDQVGSLRAVFDTSGTKVKEIVYDSFGNILSETGSLGITPPLGFAGGLHDRDTDLVRFGFRDYDPNTGRWTAKDPIGFAGGDVNMYGYTLGNPIAFSDPTGLYEWGAWFGGFIEGAGEGLAMLGDALNPFEDYFGDHGYYDKCWNDWFYQGGRIGATVGGAAMWGIATGVAGIELQTAMRGSAWGGTASRLFGTRMGAGAWGYLNGGARWGNIIRFGWSQDPATNTRLLMIHGGRAYTRFHWHVRFPTASAAAGTGGAYAANSANGNCDCP